MSPVHDFRPVPTTAEEWAARLCAHDVSKEERDAFDKWLNADPSHGRAYGRVRMVESLPMVFEGRREDIAHLLAEVEPVAPVPSLRSRRWFVPASFAAGFALLALAALFAPYFPEGDHQRVATRHGEQRSLTLPDGSVVQLNTDTQIAYRVDSDVRRVNLASGEAFFDVAKDATRPFVVATETAEIHVVGTQFSVRTRTDSVEVIVKEGKVNVVRAESAISPARLLSSSAERRVELTPGYHLRLAAAAKPPQIVAVDATRATAWRSGILDIDAMTLEEVVAEVNRYVPAPFLIEDDSIRRLQLSGRFRLADTESIRFMLRERLGVESIPRGDTIALRPIR